MNQQILKCCLQHQTRVIMSVWVWVGADVSVGVGGCECVWVRVWMGEWVSGWGQNGCETKTTYAFTHTHTHIPHPHTRPTHHIHTPNFVAFQRKFIIIFDIFLLTISFRYFPLAPFYISTSCFSAFSFSIFAYLMTFSTFTCSMFSFSTVSSKTNRIKKRFLLKEKEIYIDFGYSLGFISVVHVFKGRLLRNAVKSKTPVCSTLAYHINMTYITFCMTPMAFFPLWVGKCE
jgi:hypothetical protein